MKQTFPIPTRPIPGYGYGPRNYGSVAPKKHLFYRQPIQPSQQLRLGQMPSHAGTFHLEPATCQYGGDGFCAQNSASQLQQYADPIEAKRRPAVPEVGTLYTQEAQALQAGTSRGPTKRPTRCPPFPSPMSPRDTSPPKAKAQLVSAFNQVIGTVIASLGGILGTFAVSQILQALGIPNLASLLGRDRWLGHPLARDRTRSVVGNNAGTNTIYQGEAPPFSNWDASM